MEKLRVGCVGVGNMGRVHLKAYTSNKQVEVVALCDLIVSRCEAAKAKFGIPDAHVYSDFREMIDSEKLDAVDIATPNAYHSIVAVYALEHGLNVFCEKPDAMNVEEVMKMYEAYKKSGKVLMVMRNNRYYNHSQYLKKYIESGKAGEIYCGRCGWIRRRGIPGRGGWFTDKSQSGGGPLIDLGVHMIDLSMWLMGNPKPVAVSGCTYSKFADNKAKSDSIHSTFGEAKANGVFDVEDLAMGFIKFDNGACLQIEFSWASNIEKETRFVELRGTKSGIRWNEDGTTQIFTEDENGTLVDYNPITGPITDVHAECVNHFVDILVNGKEKDFVPEQGVNMIKILSAIYESAETGREVLL